jgi:hypothetical protein
MPTDPQAAERLRAAVTARALALEREGRLGEALRAWEGLADDLAGFGGSSAAVREVERLGAGARRELERERALVERDREWIDKALRTVATLRRTPPPTAAQLAQALDVERLRQQAADPDRLAALSAQRRIAAVAVQANHYIPTTLKGMGLLAGALASCELAALLEPESPRPLLGQARVHALAGRKADAVAALREAIKKGLARPISDLAADPELATLEGDADFEALLRSEIR